MDSSEDIAAYRAAVRHQAQVADGTVVWNRTPAHAAVVIAELFCSATSVIEIVSDNLTDKVWGSQDVVSGVRKFLSRHDDVKLRIITEHPVRVSENRFLSSIPAADFESGKVKVFEAGSDMTPPVTLHFMVVDGVGFRIQEDRDKLAAMIQFGDPGTGATLRSIFASWRSQSKQTS